MLFRSSNSKGKERVNLRIFSTLLLGGAGSKFKQKPLIHIGRNSLCRFDNYQNTSVLSLISE